MKYLWVAMTLLWGQGWAAPSPVFQKISVEEAFAQAKKTNKHIFLYWGADWCPPCNELSSEVFSRAEFSELMKPFVPLYLDGDSKMAQFYGEKFKVSGYPSLLFLDANGEELLRLDTSLTLADLRQLLTSRLWQTESFEDLWKLAKEGKKEAYWALSYSQWVDLPLKDQSMELIRKDMESLLDQIPSHEGVLKARWAARILEFQLAFKEDKPRYDLIHKALELFLVSQATTMAAAGTLLNQGPEAIAVLQGHLPQKQVLSLKERMRLVSIGLAQNKELSWRKRVLAASLPVRLFLTEKPKENIPAPLASALKIFLINVESKVKSPLARHSVIPLVAYLYQQMGDQTLGEQVLLEEARKSSSPFYYYDGLLQMARAKKDKNGEAMYQELVKKHLPNGAIALHWEANEIIYRIRHLEQGKEALLEQKLREYYDKVLATSDGFLGRHRVRHQKILAALAEKKLARLTSLFQSLQMRCSSLKESRAECQKHFANALQGGQKAVY